MATYAPPSNIEELTIFNPAYFETGDQSLTQSEADKRYLRFPNAQGAENLQAINVAGVATFNDEIVQTGATNNIVQDLTLVGDQNLLKATDIYGDLNLRRPTAGLANGGALRLWDITNNTSGNSVQIYNNGTTMSLVNLNNSGTTNITTTDGAGVQSQPLQVNSTSTTINNPTNMLKPLTMTAPLATDRMINTTYVNLLDATTGLTDGVIYANGGNFVYDNNSNGGNHNFAVNNLSGVQSIPFQFTADDMTIATTNPPTCSASSTISLSDDSAKLPSTAWVRDYVASIPAPVPVEYTYTQSFTGSLGLYNVPIPAGCVKFDIKAIGTGGLAGITQAQPPSGGYDYRIFAYSTGGGAGVAYKEGIPIPKQGQFYNNTITYINNGTGLSTDVVLNGVSLVKVYPGGNGGINVPGAGCSTPPVVNNSWGTWTFWNGQPGQGETFNEVGGASNGQIGGGCFNGGVIGYPYVSGVVPYLNQPGQGQQYSALTGNTYGFPTFGASPINYGGVIITWYIQSN